MAVVEADVAGLELERVIPKVQIVFEREDKFYSQLSKADVEKVSYRQMRVPLELRPGGAFQYFNPDGGGLGRGGGPKFDKALVSAVFLSENIEYTKLTQWSTDDPRKAVVNAVRRMTASALDEIRRQIDSQCQGDGSGSIGTIGSVSTAGGVDTYVLDSDGFGARLVRYGQVVQVFDSTLATLRGKGTITLWDIENKTIDVTPAIAGAVATDILVTDGIATPATPGEALLGIRYHHSNSSSGTWLGFARSSTPEIRSNRVNGLNSALALPLPRLAVTKMGNRVGEDNTVAPEAWLNPAQAAAYEEIGQLAISIHKQPKEEALNMYFNDNMQLAGAPVKKSFNWNQKRIDFVNKSIWKRAEILPIGFYTTDGRKIFEIRDSSGGVATSEIFYMVVGMQVFPTNPAATAYIDNLQVPDGY